MTKIGRNDPCPCGSGRKYKNCHLGKPDDPALQAQLTPPPVQLSPGVTLPAPAPDFALPDTWNTSPRFFDDEVEQEWEEDDVDQSPPSPEDEAWKLIDMAHYELPTSEWPAVIKEALKLYARCSGAYYLRAKLEKEFNRQIDLFDRAIQLANEEIGAELFSELAENAWELPHVEYGMRARNERALALVAEDRMDEAVKANEELLRLDPSDRMRVAGRHLCLLTSLGRAEEALSFLYQHGESSEYDDTLALAAGLVRYVVHGDTFFARRALADAMFAYPDAFPMLTELLEDRELEGDETLELNEEAFADSLYDELAELDEPPTAPDLEDTMADIFSFMSMAMLWSETEGAEAWLHRVRAMGPRARNAIDADPAGPALVIGVDSSPLPRCPACQGRLRTSPLILVLEQEPDELLTIPGKLRRCDGCERLAIGYDSLFDIVTLHDFDEPGRDFVPVGVIDPAITVPGAMDQTEIRSSMRRLSDLVVEGEDETEWPTQEERDEAMIERVQETTANVFGPMSKQDLFGPIS